MEAIEVVRAVSDKIGRIGAVYYFDPATLARGKELGLDGFRFYMLGRGGVLGDVPASVIVGAFGYFSQPIVEKLWNTGKERVPPAKAAAAYDACNHQIGRERLAGVAGLDAFNAAAEKVVAHAHPAALTLFSGYVAQPVPTDAEAKAIHLAAVLRELRGSAHIVAVAAKGVAPMIAHAAKRPDDMELFGYPAEPPVVSDDDRARLAEAEQLTDELLAPAYSSLNDAEAQALIAGTDAMYHALIAD